jgi:hypothetical protein
MKLKTALAFDASFLTGFEQILNLVSEALEKKRTV